jgi:4-amino-4-deoxy-L-arabinose transferase-like glycosyltransferase
MFRIAALAVFAGFFLFYNLWSGSLYAWDEAIYGEIARETEMEGLGWLTLHSNYGPFFEKPPLTIWTTALMMKLFGVNEFAVRFSSALAGFGSVMLLYVLVRGMFSSGNIALFSSLALLGFPQFTRQARMGMMDAPLTFFILLGSFLLWQGMRRERLLFFVGPVLGLAFMTKSFASFQILLIVALFAFFAGRRRMLLNRYLLSGMAVGVLLALPWHVHQYMTHGQQFFDQYFLQHVVRRAVETFPDRSPRGFLYYFGVLVNNVPLGIVGLLSLPYLAMMAVREQDETLKHACLLVLVAVFVTLGLFSTVKSKLAWYILPVYPFLAVALTVSCNHIFYRFPKKRRSLMIVALVILLLIPAIRFATSKRHRTMDYYPYLKEISISAREHLEKNDSLCVYAVGELPVVSFYSERKLLLLQEEQDSSPSGNDEPRICLVPNSDDVLERLTGMAASVRVLKENRKFLLLMLTGPSLRGNLERVPTPRYVSLPSLVV